jgi:hypothetical protein
VRDFVKASLDVAFDDPAIAGQRRMAASVDGVMGAPIGPEPIRAIMELNLKDGFQRHTYGLLHDLVPQARDSQLAHFAVSLGYFHSPQW